MILRPADPIARPWRTPQACSHPRAHLHLLARRRAWSPPQRCSRMLDTLSDVLRAIRLNGAVFFAIEASAPWVAEAPASAEIGPHIMPGVEHVIEYHVVTSGSCWGGIVDEPAVRLEAGDVIVFPQGDPHVISSGPGMRGRPSF